MIEATARTVGVVLTGGGAQRFGSNKALALLGERTLLSRVISRAEPQVDYVVLSGGKGGIEHGRRVIADTHSGEGPLGGVLAALGWASAEGIALVATFPCDVPFFPQDIVTRLAGALGDTTDCALARRGQQKHPVFGVWRAASAPRLAAAFHSGLRSLHKVDSTLDCVFVDFAEAAHAPHGDPFFNINRPEDLEIAERWLTQH